MHLIDSLPNLILALSFLSMWIANIATTAMMMPIMESVLAELERHSKDVEEDTKDDSVNTYCTYILTLN